MPTPSYCMARKLRLRAAGLCHQCARRPGRADKNGQCTTCYREHKAIVNKYQTKHRRAGLCTFCPRPREKGRTRCGPCLRAAADRQRERDRRR